MERFQKHETLLLSECKHLPDLLSRVRHWLLAEDVLAGRQRAHRPFVVQRVWQRVVYGVNIRVGEEI